jgi:cytidylate kinase
MDSDLSLEEIRADLVERYASDKKRFLELYDIEFENPRKYNDIVVNSSKQNAMETFEFILRLIENGRYLKGC